MAYFDKEAYEKLRKVLIDRTYGPDAENAEQDLTFLNGCVSAAENYVSRVVEYQCLKTLKTRTMGTGALINMSQEIDRARHAAHESMIANVRILNRLAASYGIDKIYTGDEENRYQIGDFAGELISDIFRNRDL